MLDITERTEKRMKKKKNVRVCDLLTLISCISFTCKIDLIDHVDIVLKSRKVVVRICLFMIHLKVIYTSNNGKEKWLHYPVNMYFYNLFI